MIQKVLLVAVGGAAGAVCRYLLSMIPVRGEFPVMTFLTNITGAFVIGLIVGLTAGKLSEAPELVLFLKTGFCGGFTTFSTFSLETVQLLEKGKLLTGGLYTAGSVMLSLLGVLAGMAAAAMLIGGRQ